MAEQTYRRLTRARIRRKGIITAFAIRSSLWLGTDHVLGVDSSGYAEEYKRFYFRDIQAITVAGSNRRLIWNWVLVLPLILCLGGLIAVLSNASGERWAVITLAIAALLFALPLAINNLLGPTCNCQLRTAVQTEELPSMGRLRRARKVLDRLRPLIHAAQGQLAPEEIPERMRQWESSLARPSAEPSPAAKALAGLRADDAVKQDESRFE